MKTFLLISSIYIVSTYATDYCNPDLCTDWMKRVTPHVACYKTKRSQCPSDARSISLDGELKEMILEKHNNYRNTLAGGQLSGFPSAAKMPTILWSDELAFIAGANAGQCQFKHDKCRNTDSLRWVGQNIAWSRGYPSDKESIAIGVDGWWNEYKDATAKDVAFVGNSQKMIGHFTAMAQDRTALIGCAAMVYNKNERLLVCNYSFTNLFGSPVYVQGKTGSKCTTGRNSQYPNLCSTNEPVNPRP